MNNNTWDAQHPYRRSAIRIIEGVIEPLLGRGVEGEEYYELEDRITLLIDEECAPRPRRAPARRNASRK